MVETIGLVQAPTPVWQENRTLAAIDLGTNSIHMVLAQIEPTLPSFSIVAREKETVRLGDRCWETGKLRPEVVERAIACLGRFQEIAKSYHADRIVAVATSAVREAPNGRDFLRQIDKQLDLKVNLISGQEEARRIYLGVLSAIEFDQKSHVVIDIGGGSTELVLGDGGEPRVLNSTKVGAVRLTSEFVHTDPISNEEFHYLRAYIRGMLERPVEEIRTHLNPQEELRMVGTSGTIEAVAALHAHQVYGSAPNPLNGYSIGFKGIQEIVDRLRKLPVKQRAELPGMSERRAEIILAGALILKEAMAMLGVETLTICDRALREGLIVDWMLTHGLISDQLRYHSSVRTRSVYKIAKKYHVNLNASERMAQFALRLFDSTQGILHQWQAEERELLWAAAVLHNCGLYISHNSHHKHSYYLIRHSELFGYTETELEIIANLARYHRKSPPKKKHDNFRNLTSKKYRRLVAQLSALLRLAIALDRRQLGAIREVTCAFDEKNQILYLHLEPTQPDDDCELEVWSLNYKKEVFEQEFGWQIVPKLESTPAPLDRG
ncbi:Ppx/GppA phosphatase family protein [Geitlerinema sp. PCC 9228]|jgi:exopolyphosphatase/guanosine-5'-triphosphate,3'-diphosphate pyrophosphatase|uniref:Ppx/GppA phosphatase family protein n=1 Tax=Geitlerinema sp. PCC 9228 TaxID=111611 RepID=UPI0008F99277|nr:Ppx/GppA phosphatase family protein [Geitlerinema sp. PCC 9228]